MGFRAWFTGRRGGRQGTKSEQVVHRVQERVQEDGATVLDRTTVWEVDRITQRQSQRDPRAEAAEQRRPSLGPMLVSHARDALTDFAGRASLSVRLSLELRILASRVRHDMERYIRICHDQSTALQGESGQQKTVISQAMIKLLALQSDLAFLLEEYTQQALQAENNASMSPMQGAGNQTQAGQGAETPPALSSPASGAPSDGPASTAGTAGPVSKPLVATMLDSTELKELNRAAAATWSKAHSKALRERVTASFAHVFEQATWARQQVTAAETPHLADIAEIIDRLRTLNDRMKADLKALQAHEQPRGCLRRLRKKRAEAAERGAHP